MPSRTSSRPTFAVDRAAVAVGAAVYTIVLTAAVAQALLGPAVLLAGVPVGIAVGILTPDDGEELNNALAACGLGALAVVVTSQAYGSYVSWQLGWGLDTVLAGQFTLHGVAVAFFAMPFHMLVAVPVAILVGSALRIDFDQISWPER